MVAHLGHIRAKYVFLVFQSKRKSLVLFSQEISDLFSQATENFCCFLRQMKIFGFVCAREKYLCSCFLKQEKFFFVFPSKIISFLQVKILPVLFLQVQCKNSSNKTTGGYSTIFYHGDHGDRFNKSEMSYHELFYYFYRNYFLSVS